MGGEILFFRWFEMSDLSVGDLGLGEDAAALELSCGSLGSPQASQASLGPAVGNSLDLSALEASIRSASPDLAGGRLSPVVLSPEVAAPSLLGSPPVAFSGSGEVEMLSRSSSAISVHSGTADLDVLGLDAVACGSPRVVADSLGPLSPQPFPVGVDGADAAHFSPGSPRELVSRKRVVRVLPYHSPTPPLPSRQPCFDRSPHPKRPRPLLAFGGEGGGDSSSLGRGPHSGVFAEASQQPRDELSGVGKLARSRQGLHTDAAHIAEARRQKAIARFCGLLPEKALAHFLGRSTDSIARLRGEEILQAAYWRARTRAKNGKPLPPAAINEAANALSQLYLDLDAHGVEHDGINVWPGDVNDHLCRFVEGQADKKKDSDPSRAANSHSSVARPAGGGPSREGTKPQTGFTSGRSRLRGLRHAAEWCGLNFGFDKNQVAVAPPLHVRRSQGIPAQPFTMGILLRLEAFCADDASDPVLAHVAAGMIFCALSCLRFAQAQHCWLTGIVDDEFLEGFVFQEKDPDPSRMEPRPFWGLYQGLSHGDAWFKRWWSVISTAHQPTYVFQDVLLPKGGRLCDYVRDAQGQPQWLSAPMEPGVRLISAVREGLVSVCGLTVEQAKAFGQHSARHFLPEAAKVSKEPGTCACEVGRWSGSVAKRNEARPTRDDLLDRHSTRVRRMPDLYAQDNVAARPMVVMRRLRGRLVSAVATLGGPQGCPLWGGWDALPQFRPAGDVFDD